MIAIRKDKSFFFFKERVAKNFEFQGFVDLAIPHVLCLLFTNLALAFNFEVLGNDFFKQLNFQCKIFEITSQNKKQIQVNIIPFN